MKQSRNLQFLKQILAEHPFTKSLAPDQLEFISEWASEIHFDRDEYILLEGEEANDFYLIDQGQVVLRTYISPSQGFVDVQYLGAGDVVGWSWLIPPHHWHFSALVLQPVTAIVVDGKQLRDKCETDHEFGYEIFKRVSSMIGQRLRRTRKQLE